MPKKKKPTIEEMEKMERYLACRCKVCERVNMLCEMLEAFTFTQILMKLQMDTEDAQEVEELKESAQILIEFHVAGHLMNDFGLSIDVAQSVIEYKKEQRIIAETEDDIPF